MTIYHINIWNIQWSKNDSNESLPEKAAISVEADLPSGENLAYVFSRFFISTQLYDIFGYYPSWCEFEIVN